MVVSASTNQVWTKITIRSYAWSLGHSDPDPSRVKALQMYKNLTRFTASDLTAARRILARVIIITSLIKKELIRTANGKYLTYVERRKFPSNPSTDALRVHSSFKIKVLSVVAITKLQNHRGWRLPHSRPWKRINPNEFMTKVATIRHNGHRTQQGNNSMAPLWRCPNSLQQ